MLSLRIRTIAIILVCRASVATVVCQDIVPKQALAIPSPPGYLETIGTPDPIEASMVFGTWKAPHAGEAVRYNDTLLARWSGITADDKGWFRDPVLRSAYVFLTVESPKQQTALLEGMGHNLVYMNGEPRSGNPYGYKEEFEAWEPRFDYSRVPVLLRPGRNDFLFHCSRGGALKVKLLPREPGICFNKRDLTLPDVFPGKRTDTWGAIVLINATTAPARGLTLRSLWDADTTTTPVPEIAPLSIRKVPVRIAGRSAGTSSFCSVKLWVERGVGGMVLDTATVTLRVVEAGKPRKETFRSGIDGSIQYYAVLPSADPARPSALVLSLHGAGVEAINQVSSYAPKSWAHIVAPTNRRPYGYNWEDWGRQDALEVLAIAESTLSVDPNRVYLTGHSMGGHGAYHLGSLFPDRIAAVGPSAGWISFWTYRVRESVPNPSPMRRMLMRATLPSETYTMAKNTVELGLYILHGSEDDNVLPEQSRMMAKHLLGFHKDFVYREQPGMGHWWDISDEPGSDCVDWAPMFDFFARHARPGMERVREVSFVTGNPGISSRDQWVTVEAQRKQLNLSEVNVRVDPELRRISGRTENVQRMRFELSMLKPGLPVNVMLDSQMVRGIPWPSGGRLRMVLGDSGWTPAGDVSPDLKGPHRYGPLKEMIGHNVIFVYGTRGSAEENRWAFEKARFDAERFWYQANGSIDVVADVDFDPAAGPDRSVVVFGNASTNGVWKKLLSDSPVQVRKGVVTLGGRTFKGDDLCCLFLRPRAGSAIATVGVVSGTGIVGMRLTNRQSTMMPGIGFPDCLVMSARVLREGESAIRAAGLFGLDWGVESGEWVFGE
jgi:poly(3-hydroxybutyrate) depolymerase